MLLDPDRSGFGKNGFLNNIDEARIAGPKKFLVFCNTQSQRKSCDQCPTRHQTAPASAAQDDFSNNEGDLSSSEVI
jgi:hypothetical protein